MTIRRDLDSLDERGLLAKVHGGATTVSPGSTDEPGFAAKSVRQRAEKAAIASGPPPWSRPATRSPSPPAPPPPSWPSGWSTCPALTVVTNSIPVADVFYRGRADPTRPWCSPAACVRRRTRSSARSPSPRSARCTCDMLFLGVHGMSERAGFTTPNLMEADINRALVAAAERLVVLADHTKWGTVGISSIVPLDAPTC